MGLRAWRDIATERRAGKPKLCFPVDVAVGTWFKSMGLLGCQARMSDVLRSFMYAKLAGLLRGDETLPAFQDDQGPRPDWGMTKGRMG